MAKVLVVDANWDNLVVLQRALVAEGYEVAVALSGSFALTMLERERPDLIASLSDVQDMDAYDLCSIVRADPATRGIPFLLLAGASGPVPEAAVRAGVSRIISGRFSLTTLVTQVGDLLRRDPPDDRPTTRGAVDAELTRPSAMKIHDQMPHGS